MTPPATCPRCRAERNGVQERLVLFACGSIFMRDKIGFTVVEPARCNSPLAVTTATPHTFKGRLGRYCEVCGESYRHPAHTKEGPIQPNPIAEEMTRRIPEPKVDILLEVKRDAWRRGAEAMRNEIAIALGKFQNADDMTFVADDVRNIQTPRYFDV